MHRRILAALNRTRVTDAEPRREGEYDVESYLAGFRAGRRLNTLDHERANRGARPGPLDPADR